MMHGVQSVFSLNAAAPLLPSRPRLRRGRKAQAVRAIMPQEAGGNSLVTQMTADEQKQWEEQLARTPSLGAWNGADRGIPDPKKQADEARFIYEKKAKMVFADVAYKEAQKALWQEQLARTPSLGAWYGGDRGVIDPKKQADDARFLYEKKARLVFREAARKAAAKAQADAASALYQEKAKRMIDSVLIKEDPQKWASESPTSVKDSIRRMLFVGALGVLFISGSTMLMGNASPTMAVPDILQYLDYFGCAVFAILTCKSAGENGMDLMGCLVMGVVAALGGGTVRDLLLGRVPIFWIKQYEYIIVSVLAAAAAFALRKSAAIIQHPKFETRMLWADAVSLAAFATIGAKLAVECNLHPLIVCISAMISGTFGGVIRDVCCQNPPMILTREIYASAAFIGGAAYCAAMQLAKLSVANSIVCAFSVCFLIRTTAFTMNAKLPRWYD